MPATRHVPDRDAALKQLRPVTLIHRLSIPAAARRALVFGSAGASGLVVNSVLLWLLVSGVGLGYLLAAALATQGSTTWNFFWVERLAFSANGSPGALRRYAQFAVMNNTAMLLRLPLLAVMTSTLGVHYVVANALTLLLLFVVRFGLSDRVIWAAHVTASSAHNALTPSQSFGRTIASLGLTMLGKPFQGDDLVRHVYRRAGVELPADIGATSRPVHGAAEPGDIVVFASGPALHLAGGSILDTEAGLARIRRLGATELSSATVLRFDRSAIPRIRSAYGYPQGAQQW